ncbi:MAG: 30S ribosomal protein S1, partial [Pseudomonadales bacterium]|nr:30S ribosomal protein S1 [Pseudomonadales bacterium]
DARNVLKEGEEVEAKIISVDRKNRVIGLSIKAKDIADEREAVREHKEREQEASGPTTIGDLIRQEMDQQKG